MLHLDTQSIDAKKVYETRETYLERWIYTKHKHKSFCNYYILMKKITDSAVEYIIDNLSQSDHWEQLLINSLNIACEFAKGVGAKGLGYPYEANKHSEPFPCCEMGIFPQKTAFHQSIKNDNSYIKNTERSTIEMVIWDYLKLPFRCQYFDRLLVRNLISLEALQYIHQQYNPDRFSDEVSIQILPITKFRKKIKNCFLVYGGISVLGFLFTWNIVGVISLGILLISLVSINKELKIANKRHNKKVDRIKIMDDMYFELISSGPISTKHIRKSLQIGEDKGMVWPAPLYVLLDDIEKREGFF